MGFAAAQQDGEKASFSICECVNFAFRPPREQPTACFCSPLLLWQPNDVL